MGVRDYRDGKGRMCECLSGTRLGSTQHPMYFLRTHSRGGLGPFLFKEVFRFNLFLFL